MKKLIPLLAICLAVLCFFSSCGEVNGDIVQGTWEIDFREGRDYVTYKVVVSEDRIQIEKDRYRLSGHRYPISSDVSDPMPYTIDVNGVLTLDYTVGVMKEIEVTQTFTLDEAQKKLIWDKAYSEWEYALNKRSNLSNFTRPTAGYEQYTCERAKYWLPGEEMTVENSTLLLYPDGQYTWEGVSSGRWEKNGNKLTLIDKGGWAFSRMTLDYDASSPDAPKLKENTITDGDFNVFTGFSYDLYKNVDYYR